MWEERFSVDDCVYGTEPNGFLRENESILPMGEVLCLAEGEGRNAVFLAATGRLVSSVDLTEAGVAKTLISRSPVAWPLTPSSVIWPALTSV